MAYKRLLSKGGFLTLFIILKTGLTDLWSVSPRIFGCWVRRSVAKMARMNFLKVGNNVPSMWGTVMWGGQKYFTAIKQFGEVQMSANLSMYYQSFLRWHCPAWDPCMWTSYMFPANLPLCVCRLASCVKPRTVGNSDDFSRFFCLGMRGAVLLLLDKVAWLLVMQSPRTPHTTDRQAPIILKTARGNPPFPNHPQRGGPWPWSLGGGRRNFTESSSDSECAKSVSRKIKGHKTDLPAGSWNLRVNACFGKGPSP